MAKITAAIATLKDSLVLAWQTYLYIEVLLYSGRIPFFGSQHKTQRKRKSTTPNSCSASTALPQPVAAFFASMRRSSYSHQSDRHIIFSAAGNVHYGIVDFAGIVLESPPQTSETRSWANNRAEICGSLMLSKNMSALFCSCGSLKKSLSGVYIKGSTSQWCPAGDRRAWGEEIHFCACVQSESFFSLQWSGYRHHRNFHPGKSDGYFRIAAQTLQDGILSIEKHFMLWHYFSSSLLNESVATHY